MEEKELIELIGQSGENFKTLHQKVVSSKKEVYGVEKAAKMLDPMKHNVMDVVARPDKKIKKKSKGSNGVEVDMEATVYVSRIPINFQKIIVNRAASFLIGKPIKLSSNTENEIEEALLQSIEKIWRDNKLDYKSKRISKKMMGETEVAELWYLEEVDPTYWKNIPKMKSSVKFRLRMRIIGESNGDKLYPVFDSTDNMIAFGREYQIKSGNADITYFDLYTEKLILKAIKEKNEWTVKQVANEIGKIPVIYYSQDKPEWYDVEKAIERLEILISNFADTNDYNGSPVLFLKGQLGTLPDKQASGKVITGANEADAKYVTWDQAPDSIKLEIETLFDIVYTMTQTPNITFKEMKGLGNISGVVLQLLFLDAHLKARDKQEDVFGECIQRRINYLKTAMTKINVGLESAEEMEITPEFSLFMPDNLEDTLNNLSLATGSKPIMSQKTAVSLNPLVENIDEELAELKSEQDALKSEFENNI